MSLLRRAARRFADRCRALHREQESGAVMTEFAIIFPLQLFIIMAVLQYSLIVIAHAITNHAAYMSARAMLVGDDTPQAVRGGDGLPPGQTFTVENNYAHEAARTVLATIAGPSGVNRGEAFTMPGLGNMPRRQAATVKTEVNILRNDSVVAVEVVHDFELVIPVIGRFFAFPWQGFFGQPLDVPIDADGMRAVQKSREYGAPHIPIRETGIMARPWRHLVRQQGPEVAENPNRFEPARPGRAGRFPRERRRGTGIGPGSIERLRRRNRLRNRGGFGGFGDRIGGGRFENAGRIGAGGPGGLPRPNDRPGGGFGGLGDDITRPINGGFGNPFGGAAGGLGELGETPFGRRN